MPMSTSSVPGAGGQAKAPTWKVAAAPAEPDPSLPAAAGSSDPVVHRLLAERDTAVSNGDENATQAVADALAELGYR